MGQDEQGQGVEERKARDKKVGVGRKVRGEPSLLQLFLCTGQTVIGQQAVVGGRDGC